MPVSDLSRAFTYLFALELYHRLFCCMLPSIVPVELNHGVGEAGPSPFHSARTVLGNERTWDTINVK